MAPLAPPIGPLPLSAFGGLAGPGSFVTTATIPAGTPPGTLTLQALVLDAGAPGGVSATAGVAMTIE